MKWIWHTILLFAGLMDINAQAEISVEVTPLTPYQIGEVTLIRENFFSYTGKIKAILTDHFKEATTGREVKLLVTMHPDSSVTILAAAKPTLTEDILQNITEKLIKMAEPVTRFTDYSFEVNVVIEGGATDPYLSFEPYLPTPLEVRMEHFNNLSLSEKRVSFKKWVFYEVIPVLVYNETAAKENYQAVREVGDILLSQRFMEDNVEQLTAHNPAYWQAVMETEKGDHIIPFTKVCMLLAKGEFDRAIRLLEIIRLFSARQSVPAQYFEEILEKLSSIDQMLNEQMQVPLNWYEQGKYKKAEQLYEKLLQDMPHSARLHCELFYARAAQLKNNREVRKLWERSRADILGHDPLYPVELKALNAEEAYAIVRRKQVATLFQSANNVKTDLITYAYISMEQEYYSLAGQLYWLINSYFSAEEKGKTDMSLYFLYCLKQLGDDEVILAYQGDYEEDFAKIVKTQVKTMKRSEVYRSFRQK